MNYELAFDPRALKEWQKLDKTIQQQFAKKLKKCCDNPHIPSAKLRGLKDCYKIKLRASGFRLVYQVIDDMLIIGFQGGFLSGEKMYENPYWTRICCQNYQHQKAFC